MVISSLIPLIVAKMPNHENQFLFLIGIFTIYLVLVGNRALSFKDKTKISADIIDKSISGTMLLIALYMLIVGTIGTIQKIEESTLYLFFGLLAGFL